MKLQTSFYRTGETTFGGHVFDAESPARTFAVQILLDGRPAKLLEANEYFPEIGNHGVGDGRHGFRVSLDPKALAARGVIEARLANTDIPIGKPLSLKDATGGLQLTAPSSEVFWAGGLRISGWLTTNNSPQEPSPLVTALVRGKVVAEARADKFKHVVGKDRHDEQLTLAFDLYLPAWLADGRVHSVVVRTKDREAFGSPVVIVTHQDGFTGLLAPSARSDSEAWQRAQLLDRLLPASLPFSEYEHWDVQHALPPPRAR